MKFLKLTLFILLGLHFSLHAQIPNGYYDAVDNKKNHELKTAFYQVINPHTVLEYYASATYFKSTDWHPDGYFWDMYSNNKVDYWDAKYLNREHSFPKSWWSKDPASTVAYSDLHNLYPSNVEANEAKLNYALGEVGVASYDNGVVKVGKNTFPKGYTGTVFEPADEYKGDFARTYFYMVTCYENYYTNWRSEGINAAIVNEIYPVFMPWFSKMLMQWHTNDPVSKKEIDKNNAVYKLQKNRNPFIDFPDLAEYLWGTKTNELFSISGGSSIDENKADEAIVYTSNKVIYFENISLGTPIEIYNIQGQKVEDLKLSDTHINFEHTGLFIIKMNQKAYKILIK